jgi:hypothetical protein
MVWMKMGNGTTRVKVVWLILAVVCLLAAAALGVAWTRGLQGKVVRLEAKAAGLGADSPESQQTRAELARVRRSVGFDWVGVGAAVVGAGLLAFAAAGRPASRWAAMAAVAPITYLVLSTASMAVTMEGLPVLRLGVAVGAALAYVPIALPLPGRLQYGVCCACLGTMALFFGLWEPPLPKPVAIRKPLTEMEADLRTAFPGWTARREKLPKEVEATLGADEYLDLEMSSPDGGCSVLIFVTYYANAMSKVPHVPWVCMTQSGYRLVSMRQDDLAIKDLANKEIKANVMLFEPGEGMGRSQAVMFQYFNVGGVYTYNREWTRVLATSGSIGQKGSYLSQTLVAVKFMPAGTEDPTAKGSWQYGTGLKFLNAIVPLLEGQYYPDLREDGGG